MKIIVVTLLLLLSPALAAEDLFELSERIRRQICERDPANNLGRTATRLPACSASISD